jgi:DNA-binding response OmpR family regulator
MDKRILWVDDEIELLKSHVTFLQGKGYKVDTATKGRTRSPGQGQQVRCDAARRVMPGRGGLETLAKSEMDPTLPVVMITRTRKSA